MIRRQEHTRTDTDYQTVLLTPVLINSGRKPILTAAWKKKEVKECYTQSFESQYLQTAWEKLEIQKQDRKNKTDYDFQKS